jgi:aminoglycoside phosphotransferase (APT) family kinase protein
VESLRTGPCARLPSVVVEKPDVTENDALDEVERVLGERPARATLVPTGEDNRVFELALDGRGAFAKFGPGGRTLKEAWAYRAAGDAGVPVPAVLAIEGTQQDEQAFFVVEAAGGVPVSELAGEARERALTELSAALRLLHAIPASGFGSPRFERLSADGVWEAAPQAPGLAAQAEWGLSYLEGDKLISPAEAEALRAELASRAVPDAGPSSLLHGDLASGAVFADPETGALTALIDFGDCACGPGAWEFVTFAVHDVRSLDTVLAGYGATIEQVGPLIAGRTIVRTIGAARWIHERGWDPDGAWVQTVKGLARDPARADRLAIGAPQV